MNEILNSWNELHYPMYMTYEYRSYYKDGHDNDLWILRVIHDNNIIAKEEGTDFLEAYNKIKGEPN